jgi:DNA-binding CsgD family transcriptional regulator
MEGDAELLSVATQELAGSHRRPAAASALEDAGVVARNQGEEAAAISFLGRALELNAEMGASWDATRVRSRLRRLGVRRRLVTAERPAEGWESLTPSERNVVFCVTRGMTNREVAEHLVISRHTVNSHLGHVFAKLGVSSRVALTAIAAEHDLDVT